MNTDRIVAVLGLIFIASTLSAEEKNLPKYEIQLKAVEVINSDSALAKLLKERYNAAIEIATDEMLRVETGRVSTMALGEAMDLLVGAGLELFAKPEERIAVLEESIRYTQLAEKLAAIRYDAGIVPKSDVAKAKYIRATAEIRLIREKEAKRP